MITINRNYFVALSRVALVALLLSAGQALADTANEPRTGSLTVVGRTGEDSTEYLADILVPLLIHGNGLVFADVRTEWLALDRKGRTEHEEEINAGLGYRHLLPDAGVILGANAFYDHRKTVHDTRFEQWGAGLELLSRWIDVRANYYDPENTTRAFGEVTDVSQSTDRSVAQGPVTISGGRYQRIDTTTLRTTTRTTVYNHIEEPLEGLDAEIGFGVPFISDFLDTRIYGGYYKFNSRISDDIEGAKYRVELRPVPAVRLDAEFYDDTALNHTDYYAGLALTVPIHPTGGNPFRGISRDFELRQRTIDERLREPVNRDFRIRTKHQHNAKGTDVITTSHSQTLVDLGPVPPPNPPPDNEQEPD